MASYDVKGIFQQLDECARNFTFPMLDNGYVYLADVRLTAYRDDQRWALLIEILGFDPRHGEGAEGICNAVHTYGNCLKDKPGLNDEAFLQPALGVPPESLKEEPVAPGHYVLKMKGQTVSVKVDQELTGWDFLRSLLPKYRQLLLASQEELRQFIPEDLPKILELNEWHHPHLAEEEMPSGNSTFQMIAEVLASGDISAFQPRQTANTHWSNWPEAGTL